MECSYNMAKGKDKTSETIQRLEGENIAYHQLPGMLEGSFYLSQVKGWGVGCE